VVGSKGLKHTSYLLSYRGTCIYIKQKTFHFQISKQNNFQKNNNKKNAQPLPSSSSCQAKKNPLFSLLLPHVVWVPEGRRVLQYYVHMERERERERKKEINQFESREKRRVKKK